MLHFTEIKNIIWQYILLFLINNWIYNQVSFNQLFSDKFLIRIFWMILFQESDESVFDNIGLKFLTLLLVVPHSVIINEFFNYIYIDPFSLNTVKLVFWTKKKWHVLQLQVKVILEKGTEISK